MPYTVEWHEDREFVGLDLTGKVTRSEHESSTDEVVRTLNANDCLRLLVDVSLADHKMPVGEEYEFVSGLRSRHPVGVHIALVVHRDDPADMQLVEDIARNRGLDLMLFRDSAEALGWLLSR